MANETPKQREVRLGSILHEAPLRTPEQVTEDIKTDLAKHGNIPLVQKVEIKDPFTGKKSIVMIDRTGHSEQKLIVALADPNLKRDQKDNILSMYLWERGQESASFLTDLIRYKGQHTKETRAFQSTMRFDFEMFGDMFVTFLDAQARSMSALLGVDIRQEMLDFKAWLELQKAGKENPLNYLDFYFRAEGPNSKYQSEIDPQYLSVKTKGTLIDMCIRQLEHAQRMQSMMKKTTDARERMKGKGIYLDFENKPYLVDDPELDEIIKRDRERASKQDQDD